MCVNFQTVTSQQLTGHFKTPIPRIKEWPTETWQDYPAPIIVGDEHGRHGLVGLYSMVPKKQIPVGAKRFSTMNARAETIATLRSYAQPWRDGQLCLVPMSAFYEPNYESGKAERWRISMADNAPFAVAGLFNAWSESDGSTSYSFTQITINADDHPVMKRFHQPGDEKRSLVIVAAEDYDDWLTCRNPHQAHSFLVNYPANLMQAEPVPKVAPAAPVSQNHELF